MHPSASRLIRTSSIQPAETQELLPTHVDRRRHPQLHRRGGRARPSIDCRHGLRLAHALGAINTRVHEHRPPKEDSDAVRTRTGDRARRHAAIVFEWRAAADDVAVALSAVEFFERRGASLSRTFVGVDALAADVDAKQVCEPWSVEIVRRLPPDVGDRRTTPLLGCWSDARPLLRRKGVATRERQSTITGGRTAGRLEPEDWPLPQALPYGHPQYGACDPTSYASRAW